MIKIEIFSNLKQFIAILHYYKIDNFLVKKEQFSVQILIKIVLLCLFKRIIMMNTMKIFKNFKFIFFY